MDAQAREPVELPVHPAWSFWSRCRGLLGHPAPPAGMGLLIPLCHSVHTIGMRYAIDVVFMDNGNTIRAIHRGVRPGRLRVACRHAAHTIELAAGEAAALGLRVGDRLRPSVIPCPHRGQLWA